MDDGWILDRSGCVLYTHSTNYGKEMIDQGKSGSEGSVRHGSPAGLGAVGVTTCERSAKVCGVMRKLLAKCHEMLRMVRMLQRAGPDSDFSCILHEDRYYEVGAERIFRSCNTCSLTETFIPAALNLSICICPSSY